MDILKTINDEYYETPIKDNEEYNKLGDARDNIESEIIIKSSKEVRELFKKYNDLMDRFIVFYIDNSIEFAYNKLNEILKKFIPSAADKF